MLGKHGRQHDVRRHRGVAAENAVDLGAFQSGIVERELGGHAHQVKRGAALVLAEGCKACAGDVAHGVTTSVVIPGHREAMSPESKTIIMSLDSGLALRAPRNDGTCWCTTISIRLRPAAHLLGDEAQDQLRPD